MDKISALQIENKILKKQLVKKNMEIKNLNSQLKSLENKFETEVLKQIDKAVKLVRAEYEKHINELNNKINKLEAKLNINSSNSSLPGSKNSLQTKIPNTREKTDKSKGGQLGRNRKVLEPFKEEEITETIEHTLDKCPKCNGDITLKNVVISDIIDFNIKVTKTRNKIHNYICNDCKETIKSNHSLKSGTSYGSNVKASAITLMNDANVPINKVKKYISGITNGEINLSEGYIAKLQKTIAKLIDPFIDELKLNILKSKIVHWDDTVIKINTKKGYLRFYGNEKLALIIAHETKKEKGIDNDGILMNLNKNQVLVHDHLLYNYNPKFDFKNAECNAHILRYLKGVTDNTHTHTWQIKMAELLSESNKNRESKKAYDMETITQIKHRYNNIISIGYQENETLPPYHYYKEEEFKLIKRLDKFQDAHLLFIKDFDVPFSNNTAEQSFRISKTKLKVSGLFQNINSASNYAKILSYMETCHRHGVNKHEAIKKLLDGKPYTIKELIDLKNQ